MIESLLCQPSLQMMSYQLRTFQLFSGDQKPIPFEAFVLAVSPMKNTAAFVQTGRYSPYYRRSHANRNAFHTSQITGKSGTTHDVVVSNGYTITNSSEVTMKHFDMQMLYRLSHPGCGALGANTCRIRSCWRSALNRSSRSSSN